MPLAEFNVARARWPEGDPRMAGFADNVVRVNQVAERSDGFIWRMIGDEPEAAEFPDDPLIVYTLSVWRDIDCLRAFVWSTIHKQFMMKTHDWFQPMEEPWFALWPVPEGHRPDGKEAQAMLAKLRREGPSDAVFGIETLTPEGAARP